MTIQKIEENFLRDIKADFSPHTVEMYARSVKLFNEMLAEDFKLLPTAPSKMLCADHFIRFPGWVVTYKWDGASGYSRASLGVFASGVRRFLDDLEINGIVNPTDRETLRLRKAMDRIWRRPSDTVGKTLKEGDVEKLLVAVRTMKVKPVQRKRDIALLEFMASTGCRSAEASGLKRGKINLDNMTAVVKGKGRGGGKVGILDFSETARDALIDYWTAAGISKPDDPAFSRHDNRAMKKLMSITTSTTYHVVREVMKVAGVDPHTFSPHYFRHAGITAVWNETHDLLITQKYARHSSPTTTANVYTHISRDEVREAVRRTFDKKGKKTG